MNIFILDENIDECCKFHCDSHSVKQVLESHQMLSTAHRVIDTDKIFEERSIYKATHINHPCSIWVRKTKGNYLWMRDFTMRLSIEFSYRYGKIHRSFEQVFPMLLEPPKNIDQSMERTPFAQAMPDEYKDEDAVTAYRNYYIGEKNHLFYWNKRATPYWINQ